MVHLHSHGSGNQCVDVLKCSVNGLCKQLMLRIVCICMKPDYSCVLGSLILKAFSILSENKFWSCVDTFICCILRFRNDHTA